MSSDELAQGAPTPADITAEAVRRFKAVLAQGNNIADFQGEMQKAMTVVIICLTNELKSISRGTK